jgi:AcrR family transcriptional regulator
VSSRSAVAPTPIRRAPPLPPEERRVAIIDAVLPLLIDRGVGVTSREIAAAAGVSEGTLFNVFGDKDELIDAAVEAAIDPAPFESAVASIDPSLDLRDQLVEATTLIQRRVVDIWKLVSQLDASRHHTSKHRPLPDSPALIALIGAVGERLVEPPDEAARLLRALTLSLTHPMMTERPRPAAAIVDIFLNGVGR